VYMASLIKFTCLIIVAREGGDELPHRSVEHQLSPLVVVVQITLRVTAAEIHVHGGR